MYADGSSVFVFYSKNMSNLCLLKSMLLPRYVCVLKKGYQDTDSVISSVTTKVKGLALTNTTGLGLRVWDEADYIVPPQVVHCSKKEKVQWRAVRTKSNSKQVKLVLCSSAVFSLLCKVPPNTLEEKCAVGSWFLN